MFLNELQAAAEQANIRFKATDFRQNIQFNDVQLEQFNKFYNMVIEWNKKFNLTAIIDPKDFAIKHIIDSISIWNDEKFSNVETMIDVGTGAGFPGIPLKIYKPHIKITLLDSLTKRVNFLTAVIDELSITNAVAIHSRAEDAAHNPKFRANFDIATSRAVAKLNILAEYCMPFVKIGGYFVALKGSNLADELTESSRAIKILGGDEVEVIELELPNGDPRNLIYIKKITASPKKFPRKAGTPEKKPLT